MRLYNRDTTRCAILSTVYMSLVLTCLGCVPLSFLCSLCSLCFLYLLCSRGICLFSWALGFTDPVLLFGFFALLVVCHSPWLGHIFWHFGSAGALFIWWYLLRVRPGDMPQSEGAKHDLSIISIIFFIVIKNACRRLSMVLPFPTRAQRDQCLYFVEHILFACLGYYCVFYLPEHPETSLVAPYKVGGNLFETDTTPQEGGSWAYQTLLCWTGAVYPSEFFHLYYLGKSHPLTYFLTACLSDCLTVCLPDYLPASILTRIIIMLLMMPLMLLTTPS